MKTSLYLRIASVLTFLHALLHTAGGVFGKQTPGAQQMVASVMKANAFPVMGGTVRTFWEFYLGMGLAVSVFLTLESIIFWQLSVLAKRESQQLRPLLATFLAGYVGLALVSARFFFAPPVITEILIAACLGVAFWKAGPRPVESRTS